MITTAASTYRPDETRERLVVAGLRLFGSVGLDGVSTRALAEAAQTNLNAISYHYGGKVQVYLAVAQGIVETTGAQLRHAAQVAQRGVVDLSPAQAATRAGELLADLLTVIVGAPDASARGTFIMREQMQPTPAFDILYEGFIRHVHESLSALVANATGSHPSAKVTVVRAHALLGQALAFGAARQTLAVRLGGTLGAQNLPFVRSTVAALAEAALNGVRKEKAA